MTKMQIIAKAVLTFFGLSALTSFCADLTKLPILTLAQTQNVSILRIVLFLPVAIIFIIAVVYMLIFKNDWLACKMAGSGEKLDSESETLWLVASLRMVAVLYGLILLSGSITTILNIFYICPLIDKIFVPQTCQIPRVFPLSQLLSIICDFLRAILAAYLLCGWPHFIRYQLNLLQSKSYLDKTLNTEGTKNE